MLYYDIVEDRLLPCVASELHSPRHEGLKKEIGQFPYLTWRLGLDLLGAIESRDRHAMIAVNDWQYVPEGVDRKRFYESYTGLPHAYLAALHEAGTGIRVLKPDRRNGTCSESPFFSEQTLRNQYLRHVKDLMRRGMLPEDVEVSERAGTAVCSLMDVLGQEREIYCASKSADCASEVAEMIDQAYQLTECDLFINIFPAVCRQFVEVGTELPSRLFGTGVRRVVNIALPAMDVTSREDLLQSAHYSLHDPTE